MSAAYRARANMRRRDFLAEQEQAELALNTECQVCGAELERQATQCEKCEDALRSIRFISEKSLRALLEFCGWRVGSLTRKRRGE